MMFSDGFRYFHLMRRVTVGDSTTYDDGYDQSNAFGNYLSFTIWNNKDHFSVWRKGSAFKEAHGGTSITAFLGTMIKNSFIIKSPPKPVFYDGLLTESIIPSFLPEIKDGWRSVNVTDMTEVLPSECFMACNQFFVSEENAKEFEERWAGRESKLKECDGFVTFNLLRRDGGMKGRGIAPVKPDEPTYVSCTIWRDLQAFNAWKEGNEFKTAHSGAKKQLWTKPPVPIFYEGTLVLSSANGA